MFTAEILIILVLLLLNAFFALSEMALVSSSKPLLRQMCKQGNKKAAQALNLAEDSGKFLSTVQVGITLVGTLAGAYGGAEIADKLEPHFNALSFIQPHGELVAVIIVVACITFLSVVVGELIPKQLALASPEKIAMAVARPMSILSYICTPLVFALEGSASGFFRLFGIRHESEAVTEAEVKAVLAEGAASGAIEKSEHDMLQRIIRLGDRDVKSIMTHRLDVTFIDLQDDPDTIRDKVHRAGHSRYPVIDGDANKVIGIVYAKELLDAALVNAGKIRLQEHIKPVTSLFETTPCLTALEMFKKSSSHIALIVDEYGSVEGLVTASDMLEAIVGMMPANYNAGEALVVRREDGSWLVDGQTSIHEIHLSIGLEEIKAGTDYETIAGFMIHELKRTPKTADIVKKYGFRFEVIDMDGMRIDKLLLQRLPAEG